MPVSAKANLSDLAVRLVSAIVLGTLALVTNWIGGVWFVLFWLMAALAVLAEWLLLVSRGRRDWFGLCLGATAVLGATGLAADGHLQAVFLILLAAALLIGGHAVFRGLPDPLLVALSAPYAAAVVVPVTLLRLSGHDGGDRSPGMLAIFTLFAIVWGSDVMAYFTGRTLGGPKLWPAVSPKKTWSGFIGGVVFGAIGAGIVGGSLAMVFLGALLAAISQGGDLLESALKRRFDAKDASHLIPGHGGVMDRLDGFIAAALAAALIGLVHGGADPALGFMVW